MRSYIKQGNCLELMEAIPDGSMDMILCDLPYGTTQNKWDVIRDSDEFGYEVINTGISDKEMEEGKY